MQYQIRQAIVEEKEIVSGILLEAVKWMSDNGQSLWSTDDVSVCSISQDVIAGMYYLVFSLETAIATFRYQTDDPLIWPEVAPNESAFIHRIAIKRDQAGRGVVKVIIDTASRMARWQGKKFLRLDCDRNRPKLRSLYEGLGFRLHSYFQYEQFAVARYEMTPHQSRVRAEEQLAAITDGRAPECIQPV